MSRNTGTFNFAANFEGTAKAPIDAKQLVGTKADLTGATTWNASGNIWLYDGAIVAVGSDPTPANNGVYFLKDATGYTSIANWVQLADSEVASDGITGATNGLCKNGSDAYLGGTLSEHTLVSAGENYLTLSGGTASGETSCIKIGFDDKGAYSPTICIDSVKGSTHAYTEHAGDSISNRVDEGIFDSSVAVQSSSVSLNSNGINSLSFNVQDNCMNIVSTCTEFAGIEYDSTFDIENNFTACSLVTKQYVTGLTSTSLKTATNGLTITGTEVQLGGTNALTASTTILGGAQALSLGSGGNNLGAFQVNAASAAVTTTGNVELCPTGTLTLAGSSITANSVAAYDSTKAPYSLLQIPHAGWVTGLTSQAILTASNGLCKNGTAVHMGGDLTKNTAIGGAFSLGFHNQIIRLTGDTSVNISSPDVFLTVAPPDNAGQILTRNASTGEVSKTTLASLGGLTGATNGIGTTGQKVCLGGTLAAPTTISGTQLLTLGDLNGICLSTANTNDIALNTKSNGAIYLKSQSGTVASSNDTANAVLLAMDYNASVPMLITDNSAEKYGLVYATDYSNTYQDHSLVDKYYVDSIATGLNVHAAVAVASEVNLPLSGNTGTVDGISVADIIATNNRILVKDQTDGTENGIYSASTGVWGRTDDYNFNPSGEVANGDLIPVTSGDTDANSQWILVTPNPIISGTTELEYSLFAQQFGITDGNGICVTTVGTNKNVAVKLSATNPGLCFDSQALEIDYNIFRYGLTCSVTTGKVDVRATTGTTSGIGNEIDVRIDPAGTNKLYVDKNDFSYTSAANGLTKDGCNVVLGGAMTGDTTICIIASTSLTFQDDRTASCGIEYAGAYKDDFTIHSLVDKDYADSCDAKVSGATLTAANNYTDTCVGTAITGATNGLCATGQDVCLGGALCNTSTNIDLAGNCLNLVNDGLGYVVNFDSANDSMKFATDGGPTICVDGGIDVVCMQDSGNIASIYVDGTTEAAYMITTGSSICVDSSLGLELNSCVCLTVVDDSGNGYGLQYDADYSTTFQPNSLVDKCYVDACVGSVPVGTVTSVTATTTTTGTDISVSVANETTTPAITLCIPTASATARGALSSADWSTFNAKTTCVGTVTSVGTTAPLTGTVTTSGTLGITQATTSTDGYLSSTDWNTFNSKTTCTGTVTGANNGLCATSTTVSLGGALTGNTTINGAHTLCLGSVGNELSGVQIYGGSLSSQVSNTMGLSSCGAATFCSVTGVTTIVGTGVCITGALETNTTATIGGNLTLSTVDAGSTSDDVLTITSGGVVQKISSSSLGEDNNSYVTSGVTTTVTLDDTYFAVLADSTGGAFTITLPAAPTTGQAYKIKDGGLDALTNNITIAGNGKNIDGDTTVTINTDGGAVEVVYDGTTWNVLSFVN